MIDDLYDLIGGRQTVSAATEAFYRRVFADDTLSAFFKTTDMAQLCSRQSMFISMLLASTTHRKSSICGRMTITILILARVRASVGPRVIPLTGILTLQ